MQDAVWIVLADASRARVVETDPTLTEGPRTVEIRLHPESRLKDSELLSDTGAGVRRPGPRTGPTISSVHEKEAERFADELAEALETARAEGRFDRLIIVAPPPFLGLLRKELTPETAERVDAELDRDLTRVPPHELLEEVRRRLEKAR